MSTSKSKQALKVQLAGLLSKEAQKLVHYELTYRNLSVRANKLFGGENQQITPEFQAMNQELNKAISDMEKSEVKCKRYEELLMQIKSGEIEGKNYKIEKGIK